MPTRLSVRIFSILGIPIRVHVLFLGIAVFTVVRTRGYTEAPVLLGVLGYLAILFLSILGHELGHAIACRRSRVRVHGILIWHLGGLTYHDPERSARAQLRISLAGVAVNFALALVALAALLARDGALPGLPRLAIEGDGLLVVWNLNLALAALNLLPGLPFDGGAALEALLWPRFGRAKARFVVIGSGLIVSAGILMGGITLGEPMLLVLGAWALLTVGQSYREFREHGVEDETLFGVYDFSGGYTSLEASHPEPDAAERRRAKERERAGREERRRAAAERAEAESAQRNLDRLLDRIAAEGIASLTPEERAFLDAESRRLRARGRGKSPTRP